MSKKNVTLFLGFSLFLVSTAFAPRSFAADVETVGNLQVQGVIESTSGGFKFPDGSTMNAAGMNGLLFNHGFVVDNSGMNIGNLTSGAIKFGAGDGATGEGIASTRQPSYPNQNGLDFYTNSTARLSITNDGKIGIGTQTPQFQLTEANSSNTKWTRAQFGYRYPLYLEEFSPTVGFNVYWDNSFIYGSSHPAGMLAFDMYIPGGFGFMTAPSGTGGANATMTTRLAITNDGKVGIGTTTPTQALDVVGNLKVSGTIDSSSNVTASGGFKYSTSKSRYLVLHYSAFVPDNSSVTYASGSAYRYITGGGSGAKLRAPVQFPEGAVIKDWYCLVADSNSTYDVQITLNEYTWPGTSSALLWGIATSTGSAGTFTQIGESPSSAFIASNTKGYFMQFANDSACGGDCGLASCRIHYEVDQAD